ncbi:flagellar hook-associated protein FlgL [soil metagenome]
MRVSENMRLANTSSAQSRLAERLDKASRVASRGSRVAAPSDDPVAYGTKVRGDNTLALIERRSQLATKVSGELDVAEGALSTATDLLSQARATAVEGANDTLDANARKLLGTQVKALREEMLGLGNTRYGTKYIFGGTQTDTAPFDASGNFVGNDITTRVPLMDGVEPPANVSGARAFTAAGGQDVLAALQTLSDALDANDPTTVRAAIGLIDSSHTQLVQGQTEAGLSNERFKSAVDVMANTKVVVSGVIASQVEGDPMQHLTELTLAKSAYEQGVAVTRQLLSLSSLTRQ